MSKVFIGAPVRNRAWVLNRYIAAIQKQDIDYETCYIVNDCVDNTEEILQEHGFKTITKSMGDTRPKGHLRGYYTYFNLATLRNMLLDEFLKSDCDYFFSVDTDIIIPENSISQLIKDDKDIISMLIKNHPDIKAHNIMKDYTHIEDVPEGIIPVDITGAVYLIKRSVIEAEVKYGWHIQGEDVYFCDQAKEKGFELWSDTRLTPIHAYKEGVDLIAEVIKGG